MRDVSCGRGRSRREMKRNNDRGRRNVRTAFQSKEDNVRHLLVKTKKVKKEMKMKMKSCESSVVE